MKKQRVLQIVRCIHAKVKVFSVVVMVAVISIGYSDDVVLLHDSLDQIPSDVMVENGENLKVVKGRSKAKNAVFVENSTLTWELDGEKTENIVAFWLRPVAWDGNSEMDVEICSIGVGGNEYVLKKEADNAVLFLQKNKHPIQIYPIYNWHENNWLTPSDRQNVYHDIDWHYVAISLSKEGVLLAIDGFPARIVTDHVCIESIDEFKILANPGTAFSELTIKSGSLKKEELWTNYRNELRGGTTAQELWRRYRSQKDDVAGEQQNILSVPYTEKPPQIDGQFDASEWQVATELSCMVAISSGNLLNEMNKILLCYDESYIYIAAMSHCEGTINARRWSGRDKPIWREESWEIYLAPPDRDIVQFIVNPYGDISDLKGGEISWNGGVQFKTLITENMWFVEGKIDFKQSELPVPENGDMWKFNMINSQAGASWQYPNGVYNSLKSMGELQFVKNPFVIKLDRFEVDKKICDFSLVLANDANERELSIRAELSAIDDDAVIQKVTRNFLLPANETITISEHLPLGDISSGTISLRVIENGKIVFYQTVKVPIISGR